MRLVGAVFKNVTGCLVGKAGAEALSTSRGHFPRGTGQRTLPESCNSQGFNVAFQRSHARSWSNFADRQRGSAVYAGWWLTVTNRGLQGLEREWKARKQDTIESARQWKYMFGWGLNI